jgi:catechol-2,3-dioxygenase
MAAVQRLNHAVLYVGDVAASVGFYSDALGMEVAHQFPGAAFMKSAGSANDHDLGLFQIGTERPGPAPGRRGLYHLAWQVDTIDDLVAISRKLSDRGSLVGMSDHGASKSLYAVDPDGIEIEIMWAVPVDSWPAEGVGTRALSLDAEFAKWTGVATGHQANVAASAIN